MLYHNILLNDIILSRICQMFIFIKRSTQLHRSFNQIYKIRIVYQYSETNVMHFSLSLLRIKGLYMFRAILVHLQEALHKRHLVRVYGVRVTSVGCSSAPIMVQPIDITRTQYSKCRLCSAF
jgi:hypothetical protein